MEETVPVSGRSGTLQVFLQRRTDGNSSKRECARCKGSRLILPALMLTLDK